MDRAITLGPLALSLNTLIWLSVIWLGLWVGSQVAKRAQLRMEWHLYGLLLLGVLWARLGFVAQHLSSYLDRPLSILDVRDGGWSAWTGLAATAVMVLAFAIARSPKAKPLASALLTVGVIGMGTTLGMRLVEQRTPGLVAIEVSDLQANPVHLQSFQGQPLVVNLWATWCPPCIREMPVLQKAQEDHPEIVFLFLNQGESQNQVQQFLDTHELNLDNVLLDPTKQAGQAYASRLLPTTLFFDAQGKLVDLRLGELSTPTLNARLSEIAH